MMKTMAGIYIINDDKILMLKRTKKESFGQYFSVGGRFEKEELNNPHACVLRELKEESGIEEKDLDDLHLKYISFRKEATYISQNYVFFATLKNTNLTLPICDEGILEWVDQKDIFDRNLPAGSMAYLKHYFKEGQKNKSVMLVGATNQNDKGKYEFIELLEFTDYNFDSII